MSECHIILTFFLLHSVDFKQHIKKHKRFSKHNRSKSAKMSGLTAKASFGMKYE